MGGFGNQIFGGSLFGGGGNTPPPPPPPTISVLTGIIYRAFRIAGRLTNAQRGLAPEEIVDAFQILNEIIDTMATEHLFVYTVNRTIQNLVPNQQDYFIGTGAPDFNVPRPVRIENASLLFLDASSDGPIELPMRILTVEEWQQQIPLKQVPTTVSYLLYYEPQFPFGIVHLWPIVTVVQEIALYLWQTITPFATVNDTVSLPPAYLEFLRYRLAQKISEVFPGANMTPSAMANVEIVTRKIKNLNRQWNDVACDPGIVSKLTGRYQWWTGDVR